MEPIIEAKILTKTYANKKVFNNLNLSVEKGETLAILGENGSGKSTLLQLVAGLLNPSEGTIEKMSFNIRIGYVPEQFPSDIRFTVSEYLYHLGRIEGLSKLYLQQRIGELLVQFRLTQSEGMKIKNFSKGMKHKVGIMQALLSKPDILILDEPLSGLDPAFQQELESILYRLKSSELTMILTCHHRTLLQRVADRVVVLENGQIADDYLLSEHAVQEYVKIETEYRRNVINLGQRDGLVEMKIEGDLLILFVIPSESDHTIIKLIEEGASIKSVNRIDASTLPKPQGNNAHERDEE